MTERNIVYESIDEERDYQDLRHGPIESHNHTVGEWLVVLNKKVNDATDAWYTNGDNSALQEIVQVAATAVACLEQFHAPERTAEFCRPTRYTPRGGNTWPGPKR